MQHRTARIFPLQVFLHFQGFKRIVRVPHGKLRRIRVVGVRRGACLQNVRESLLVFLRKAIRRPFGGRRFQVVHMVSFRLESYELLPNMIEKPHGHRVARLRRNVVGVPGEVSHHLINAVHTDCREVIALRVREKPFVNMALNDLALNFQRLLGEIQQIIQPLKKRLLVSLE